MSEITTGGLPFEGAEPGQVSGGLPGGWGPTHRPEGRVRESTG
ncbi:hypothetical protein GCM10022252_25200 [Streptosporangium oxazolinicum]|uniref:Uncharacterized protein n=1 Tax=Streptosporangium oxazolinicum TaxID=909287 RepID=A0ABP8ART9_9ACTN